MHDTALNSIEKIKLVLSSAIAVVLALALSMQASFVSINTMSCDATGQKKVAVGEFDTCCELDVESFGIEKSACCDFQTISKTFNFISQSSDLDFVAVPPFTETHDFRYIVFESEKQNIWPPSTGPPKPSGRQILTSISKWTI